MVEHSPKILASVEKVTTTTIIQACAKKAKGKEKSDASDMCTSGGGFFLECEENVRQFIPRLRFFFGGFV